MPQFHCLGPLDVGVVTVYVYFRATVSRPLSKRRLKPLGLLTRVGSRPTPLPFITHAATAPRGLPALQPLFLQPGHWDLWRWTVESQLQKGSCREDILWGLQPHIQKVGGSEIHPAGRQVGVESCRQMMAVPYTVARAHTHTHARAQLLGSSHSLFHYPPSSPAQPLTCHLEISPRALSPRFRRTGPRGITCSEEPSPAKPAEPADRPKQYTFSSLQDLASWTCPAKPRPRPCARKVGCT